MENLYKYQAARLLRDKTRLRVQVNIPKRKIQKTMMNKVIVEKLSDHGINVTIK